MFAAWGQALVAVVSAAAFGRLVLGEGWWLLPPLAFAPALAVYASGVARCGVYPRGGRGLVLWLVDTTWSLPNTVAGSALYCTILLRGGSLDPDRSRGTATVRVDGRIFARYATTVGIVIAGSTPRLDAHEGIHVTQARLLGPLYPPLVGVGFVVATLFPYWLGVSKDRRKPVKGLRGYFADGVYRHTWHESWAYRRAGPR